MISGSIFAPSVRLPRRLWPITCVSLVHLFRAFIPTPLANVFLVYPLGAGASPLWSHTALECGDIDIEIVSA